MGEDDGGSTVSTGIYTYAVSVIQVVSRGSSCRE